ncbi:MAG: DNA-protecting protein DprA [Acidobacteria bacterium]|nr:DNA-protecting protein DprA [Acidobacteriota bacterium]
MATLAGSQEAQLYWLALHLVPGLGTGNAVRLIRKLGSPQAVFHASLTELEGCGLRAAVAQSIVSGVSFEDAAAEAEKVRAAGAEIVTWSDPRYPECLKEIFDPPVLLYARGRVELLRSFQIAVVGSRKPSPYGRAVAEKLAGELGAAGLVISSGMARGIDTAAHQGALRAGGDTLAVLGCGIDMVYPTENRKLMAEMAEKGLLVAEFPMETAAFPQNFPIRNRIISGMSTGVMIVEGAEYSGSLITARLALDQGREVFAVPGNIVSKLSWAPNLLIKQGATLVQSWQDVVEALPTPVRRMILEAQKEKLGERASTALAGDATSGEAASSLFSAARKGDGDLSTLQRRLIELLQVDTSTHIDAVIGQMAENSASEIIAALCELELAGHIRQLPGRNFVRVW